MTINRYKYGFFILLSLFILFWLWILLSILSNTSPRSFLRNLFTTGIEEQGLISPSFYEEQTWIDDITPDGVTRKALSENGNKLSIRFSQAMDTSYAELYDWSVQTEELPLDYSNTKWADQFTFVLTLDRSLGEGELMILTYRFHTAEGLELPPVVLNYE